MFIPLSLEKTFFAYEARLEASQLLVDSLDTFDGLDKSA